MITFTTSDGKTTPLLAGDMIDLGEGGLIYYFSEPLATAVRTFSEKSTIHNQASLLGKENNMQITVEYKSGWERNLPRILRDAPKGATVIITGGQQMMRLAEKVRQDIRRNDLILGVRGEEE